MCVGALALLPLVSKVKIIVGIARGIVFMQKTQDEVRADPYRIGAVGESRLHRHNILLNEVSLSSHCVKLKTSELQVFVFIMGVKVVNPPRFIYLLLI